MEFTYKKHDNEHLFSSLAKHKLGLHKLQNYIPLYSLFFALNDANWDSINLNNVPSYDYLLSLPITALTTEKIDDINQEFKEKKDELDTYKNTSIQNLWLGELDEFEKVYEKWLSEMNELTSESTTKKDKEKGKGTKTIKKVEKKEEGTKIIKKVEKKEEPKTKIVKKTK